MFVDVHSHVTPLSFPGAPNDVVASKWPCMRCASAEKASVYMGATLFRELDHRSWDVARRIEDMDRDSVSIQVLSPMPELLSYWMDVSEATIICDTVNHQIASMIAAAPRRFRGLGAVPMQNPAAAAKMLPRLRETFGLAGVEIGSNISGTMLGDERLEPFWEAAEAADVAIFIHALHPVAAKPIDATPVYTAFSLFPIDVAMAAASILLAGVLERHPRLRVAFSHGGGAIGSILGRLDTGWQATGHYAGKLPRRPSEYARDFFYDSNVYDQPYLRYLIEHVAPGRVFAGTDYPYPIMQTAPLEFVRGVGLDPDALSSLCVGAAGAFLDEDFSDVIA